MSLISFGMLIFSSEEEKINARENKVSVIGCYMRTEHEVDKITYRVLDQLFIQSDFYTEVFELSDGPKDNTVQDLCAPKYYCEVNGKWQEKTPTLFERLKLLQLFLEEVFIKKKPIMIKLCISEQGYPLLSDCKIIDVSLNQLSKKLYEEFEQYGGVPTLLITIR